MDKEDIASKAVNCCVDIYNDYDQDEVNKYAPPSVQKAWDVGRVIVNKEKTKNMEKLKDFEL